MGKLTEIGCVHYPSKESFYGDLRNADAAAERGLFQEFESWMWNRFFAHRDFNKSGPLPKMPRAIMVSDNPAYDFQWINDGFWRNVQHNPFGHSARRLADFYAGLCGEFSRSQDWKSLRVTPHDHNPVNDAMGNLEAFERMLKGERGVRR